MRTGKRQNLHKAPWGKFFGICTELLLDGSACLYFRFGLDILGHGGVGGNVLDIGLIANMNRKKVKFAQNPLGEMFWNLHRTFTGWLSLFVV